MEKFFKGRNLMFVKLLLATAAFFLGTINLSAQVPILIEKASSDVFLSFIKNKSLPISELESLSVILNSEIDDVSFQKEFAVTKSAYDSLRNHFLTFESESQNISSDSTLVLFNQWYLHLSNTFYDYFKQKFFSSSGTKIILFSTSMSCHCTLEMCKNQTIDILKFIKENDNEYEYWIVDSYENNELQIKYDALFAPAVIVLDSENTVLKKIEYEEKMIDQLKNYLIGEL